MTASPEADMRKLAAGALEGDQAAMEELVRTLQPVIFKIAQRFLFSPADAEDAVQEILLKIITRLGSYRGESRFSTWAYAIAVNYLRDVKRKNSPPAMSFEEFSEDLSIGLADEEYENPDEVIIKEEVRIGCTLAMLQCLDVNARLAYTLGEILELDHIEAAEVMQVSPAAYRKRLSRAREKITNFMLGNCGLVESNNKCRCGKRASQAIALGRVDPGRPQFAISYAKAKNFPEVLSEIRNLKEQERAAALYRAQAQPDSSIEFSAWLRKQLEGSSGK